MARASTNSRGAPIARWWQAIPEKVAVAAATALATGLITIAGPPLKDYVYSRVNKTQGATEREVSFQQDKWQKNPDCAGGSPLALWHDAGERQIDATICPRTGDILVQMRDSLGRQFQWWPDLTGLNGKFEQQKREVSAISAMWIGRALAAEAIMKQPAQDTRMAQMVLCQIFLPDGRGLRRRLVVGPNQCVELFIDSFTGQVISQRPVPCVPNCAMNV